MTRAAGGTREMIERVHPAMCRAALATALVAVLAALGCATAPLRAPLALPLGAVVSPELAFLIAREHEMDGDLEAALAAYQQALEADPESAYLLKQVAELAARVNRLSEALAYAERAHEVDPDDLGVRLFLGTLYRFRRDTESAKLVLLDEAGHPLGQDAALLLYGVLADAARYEEARGIAEWMVESDSEGLRGFFALADAREKLGDPAGAEAALRRGLEHHPGELALYGALAKVRRDRGDRAGEIEVYRELLADMPNHHATLLALAEAQLALQRTEEALETLRLIEEAHPGDLRSMLRVAFLEFERENFQAAAERFERALARRPDQHEVAYFLGIVRRRMDDEEAALRVFERIPEDHDRYADARTQIAAIFEKREEFERARAEVERARAAAPSRPLDIYLASLRARAGDVAGALAFLEGLLTRGPEDAELLYHIGVIHGEAKNVDEAIGTMKRVLEKDPDHAGALNYVGYTWAERGVNLEEAEAMITRAVELRPDDGYIADSLGWVYYMRAQPLLESGRVEEAHALLDRALVELQRAAELTGGDSVISEHLGDLFLLLGQKERALRMYEEALRLEPRFDEQPALLKKLEELRRELQQR
jgi:tetratricopeptide (TPR) repeat protein